MGKFFRQLRRHCGTYALICVGIFLLAAILLTAALCSTAFADFYTQHISSRINAILALCNAPFPCSLAECLLLCAGVILFVLICAAVCATRRGRLCAQRFLCGILATCLLLLSAFVLCYGIAYHCSPLADKLNLCQQPVSAAQLSACATWLAEKTNAAAAHLTYDTNGFSVMPYRLETLNVKLREAFGRASTQYPFLPVFFANAKPVILSEPWTYTHTAGIFTFFTGETNLNVNLPDYTIPFTAAHEFSHQRGIAPENEANFMAFLVLSQAQDPYLQYSAYLNAFSYFSTPLYRADPDMYQTVLSTLLPAVRNELHAYNHFFEKYSNSTAARVSDAVNSAYLQSQGQTQGTRSYGLVVDLLVAYYQALSYLQ